jgi:hypothetical protein
MLTHTRSLHAHAQVAQYAEVNAMGATNLATCFGPNLLTNKDDNASLQELLDLTPLVTRFILKCIDNRDLLFEEPQQQQQPPHEDNEEQGVAETEADASSITTATATADNAVPAQDASRLDDEQVQAGADAGNIDVHAEQERG